MPRLKKKKEMEALGGKNGFMTAKTFPLQTHDL